MRNDAGINGDAQRIEQMAWMLFLKVYDAKEQDWDMNEDNYESIIPEECRWCNWAVDDRSGSAMTGDTLLDFVNNTLFPTMKSIKVDPNTPIKKAIVKTAFEDVNQYMKDGVLLRQLINIIDELDLSDYAEIHAFGAIYEDILKELQLTDYDPLQIVEKTKGRTAEDDMWLKFAYYPKEVATHV